MDSGIGEMPSAAVAEGQGTKGEGGSSGERRKRSERIFPMHEMQRS